MGLSSLIFRPAKEHGFCAFCRAERKYPSKKHLTVLDVFAAIVLSLVVGGAIWEMFDPRSFVLFTFAIGSGEVFIFLRWRHHMVCRYCGFDPVLYNVSPNRAREKVRQFYEDKIKSPNFILSKSPLLEVYRSQLERERVLRKIEYVKGRQQGGLVPREASKLNPTSSSSTPSL
ncbi:MAG TPA: hypothetical protein DCL41_05940 [Bdellovibrionales bacterium]|nr:hypothetical protein [Pseudobdellovibrionaceae bacterium]HAG91391.1 hypothetical protein [Bdellovibrionales bacterium]|tara:strand:+ start:617 stop:1135 length:519 start_codon:yes stop_codon:yes gene_type:complete